MSEFAPEARAGAPPGLIAVGRRERRRRARGIAIWLRLVAILAASAALWAVIIAGVRWLFTL